MSAMLSDANGWGKEREAVKPGVVRYAASMILYYVHDPMCSWCWAFRPLWAQLKEALQEQAGDMRIVSLLGGLAPDSDVPMPQPLQTDIQRHWQVIQRVVPGTDFNFDFWTDCSPRRSTWPACRAVIAAGMQHDGSDAKLFEEKMIFAIQQAYYLQARNPSDEAVLKQLAVEIGLDRMRFTSDLDADVTRRRLEQQIALARRIGAQGFPCLIVTGHGSYHSVQIDYRDALPMLEKIIQL